MCSTGALSGPRDGVRRAAWRRRCLGEIFRAIASGSKAEEAGNLPRSSVVRGLGVSLGPILREELYAREGLGDSECTDAPVRPTPGPVGSHRPREVRSRRDPGPGAGGRPPSPTRTAAQPRSRSLLSLSPFSSRHLARPGGPTSYPYSGTSEGPLGLSVLISTPRTHRGVRSKGPRVAPVGTRRARLSGPRVQTCLGTGPSERRGLTWHPLVSTRPPTSTEVATPGGRRGAAPAPFLVGSARLPASTPAPRVGCRPGTGRGHPPRGRTRIS